MADIDDEDKSVVRAAAIKEGEKRWSTIFWGVEKEKAPNEIPGAF